MTEMLGLVFCAAVLLLEALHRRERAALLSRLDGGRPTKKAKLIHASAHRRALARQRGGDGHESV